MNFVLSTIDIVRAFDLETLSTIAFFAVISILLIKDRRNVEFQYGLIIRRMQKGKRAIDKFVKGRRRALRFIGNIAVCIGIVAAFVSLYFLIRFTLSLQQAFKIVLPSVGKISYPEQVMPMPFWYWIVGVFIIIASHETMHAVFARLERVRIKSYGFLLLLFFPIGAFVDPDMKEVARLKPLKKLRIFAAGSFGNFIVGLLIFLIFISSIKTSNYLIESVGVSFKNTIPGTPAHAAGLNGIIYQIDNESVKDVFDLGLVLSKRPPGSSIMIITSSGEFRLTTIEHPDIANASYIGIADVKTVYKYRFDGGVVPESVVDAMFVWLRLLFWLFILSVGVGLTNMLPMKPFDGGYIFEELFNLLLKSKKKGRTAINIASVIVGGLLLVNLFGVSLIKSVINLI